MRPFAGKRFLKLLKKFVFVSLGLGDCTYIDIIDQHVNVCCGRYTFGASTVNAGSED